MSTKPETKNKDSWKIIHKQSSENAIERALLSHLEYSLGEDQYTATLQDVFIAMAHVARDLMMERWIKTQQAYHNANAKRVYYLSMEYLIGRLLGNSLISLGIYPQAERVLKKYGYRIDDVLEEELDAGLGNGGLGRLAACFMDSMATQHLPAFGYGIRYEYGLFHQRIQNGYQREEPDNWMGKGNHWQIPRPKLGFPIKLYGRTVKSGGKTLWVEGQDIHVMPYDILVPGFHSTSTNTLRLWSIQAKNEFDLEFFNDGDYTKAWERIVVSENISKVLYPRDDKVEGKELRLKQEYFFSAASIHDILRRHLAHNPLDNLAEKVAIHLNDTHPAIAIPELMRVLVDEKNVSWDKAWNMTQKVFAYTNHTLMSEAMEKWSVDLLGRLLPRHLEIIYKINELFLKKVRALYPDDTARVQRMSLIDEGYGKQVRMAHLSIIGSHSINGVARLHSDLLKTKTFKDFYDIVPSRFNNKTNGITPRHWLLKTNPPLAGLITQHIGDKWTVDLYELRGLIPLAKDQAFQKKWRKIKLDRKKKLADEIFIQLGIRVRPQSLFDCQVKRIHEYKRQHLNLLHIIYLYQQIRLNPKMNFQPRVFIFGGKAAPGYFMAKRIIKLIHSVAEIVNNDPVVRNRLKVVFLPNYNVSLAEKIMPAADLSEQISTAGTEASGTGNMKFCLNGALTIGTLDGANIEIREQVGPDNIFIFGMNAGEVAALREKGYRPADVLKQDPELNAAVELIRRNHFSKNEPGIFEPFLEALINHDYYLSLADFRSYAESQSAAQALYLEPEKWAEKSILNVANTGKFSCDRTIRDYAQEIWKLKPVMPEE